MTSGRVLVLGASGYIGAQLVAALLEKGYPVRAAGRSLAKLERCSWAKHNRIEIVQADVLNEQGLPNVFRDCEVVYYLVHSLNPYNKDFVQADRQAAQNTIECAGKTGVRRIIYLGGLGENEMTLSKHLRSRMEVLHILHSGKVPVTTLRAAMIIGRGSISFEILRCLVNRLPVLLAPSWVSNESQPIAVVNVIHYLVACLELELTVGQVFDIGGPDVLSYRRLMDIYAQEVGLKKRLIIPVPSAFIPILSFWWIRMVTPFPVHVVRPLVEGLRNRAVCQDNRIREIIAQKLLNCHEAIRYAIL